MPATATKWNQTRTQPHEKWESECRNFDILHRKGSNYVLVSYIHEPVEYGQCFWSKAFKTLSEAQSYADFM